MLGNLADNAFKWAQCRVRITAALSDPEWLVIDVADDGPGLAPDRRAEVLERGQRLDESTPGSGLGLDIARDLAELYGGDIELDDAPEGGLLVKLTLPAAR